MYGHHREASLGGTTTTAASAPVPTTTIFTPEALHAQLQSDVAVKLDCSLSAHHMTYGALLREIEKLLFERKETAKTAHDAVRRADLANRQLEESQRTVHDLQQTVDHLRHTIDEKEHAMLRWGQRYSALEGDMRQLRSELERVVKEADHNRQLLATEVRSRAALLETVHEEVRNDLQRRLAPRSLSPAAPTTAASPPPRPLESKMEGPQFDAGQEDLSPVRRLSEEAVQANSVMSPSTSFQQLHRAHEGVVADVRRQLAVDVPRRVADAAPNQSARDYYNGAHHTTTATSGAPSSRGNLLRTPQMVHASPSHLPQHTARAGAFQASTHGMLSPPPPPWRLSR